MGQDVTEKQVFEALRLYKKRYGNVTINPQKWDDIVTEVKYGNKGVSSKKTPREAREDDGRGDVPYPGYIPNR